MRTYKGLITKLNKNEVFVFGSNTQGRHGSGAAFIAKTYFGAKIGQSSGLMGQSYGIVTKDITKKIHPSIPVKNIKIDIMNLYLFAIECPQLTFYVAYSGKGKLLSGFTPQQMSNMFLSSAYNVTFNNLPPNNIVFEESFAQLMTI